MVDQARALYHGLAGCTSKSVLKIVYQITVLIKGQCPQPFALGQLLCDPGEINFKYSPEITDQGIKKPAASFRSSAIEDMAKC